MSADCFWWLDAILNPSPELRAKIDNERKIEHRAFWFGFFLCGVLAILLFAIFFLAYHLDVSWR